MSIKPKMEPEIIRIIKLSDSINLFFDDENGIRAEIDGKLGPRYKFDLQPSEIVAQPMETNPSIAIVTFSKSVAMPLIVDFDPAQSD